MRAVDQLEVTILVDNTTDSLSSRPAFVESEFAGTWRRGMKWLGGKCLCCAAHGLSCLLTARRGDTVHTLLFDTGPEEWVFERNVVRLGIDLGMVEGLVLSHGHWDHAGAMPRALQMITLGNGGRTVPTYMHPGMFALRGLRGPKGVMPMELVPSPDVLTGNGAEMVLSAAEQTVLDEMFYVSGEIPRVTPFETGLPGHCRMGERGEWEPDELLMDERFVSVHVAGKGQIIFSACSHAGLINVLTEAAARFPDVPIYGVFGGFHLSGATEGIIPQTVAALKGFEPQLVAAGHCTGWRAMGELASAFGSRLVPSAVGSRYTL